MDDIRKIDAEALHAALRDGGEIALLDPREEALFASGHILLACNVPLSRLEFSIRDLVPRLAVRVVLCDSGEAGATDAARAAERMRAMGYADISVLDGGMKAWAEAGKEVFTNVNVPSKLFGEYVEHKHETPSLAPEEVQAKLDAGENVVILDSRPFDEFRRMSIPTGIDTPGAELVYRVRDLVPDPTTLVVVNCAGRTRSIVGAQSLINAGLRNPVVALRNGTMGWKLAGLDLDNNSRRQCGPVSDEALIWAEAAAQRVARRFGVRRIGHRSLDAWRAQTDDKTLYIFDVRYPEEYETGHVPGARPAPGGQLVQATDAYVGTRNARIVLSDDTGVRATMTASWLIQMGWTDVYVLDKALYDRDLETGAYRPVIPEVEAAAGEANFVDPADLRESVSEQRVTLIDLAPSLTYRANHIPGAWWAVRSRLEAALPKLPEAPNGFVLTSPDGALATLAARDLKALTDRPVAVLKGGTDAYQRSGFPMAEGMENPADDPVDQYYLPYDGEPGPDALRKRMQAYLDWELGLVEQMRRDGTLRFRHSLGDDGDTAH